MRSFLLILILVWTAFAWAGGKNYDCGRCDSEESRKKCFDGCVKLLSEHEKWNDCMKTCESKKTREDCLMTCFPVCENMTGGPIGEGTDRGTANCGKCDGKVVLVQDEMASDGSRIQVCQGKMRAK